MQLTWSVFSVVVCCFCVYYIPAQKSSSEPFGGPNIALGKPTVQFLSTFYGGSAYKAVDGNTSDDVAGDMCAHTSRGTPSNPAWWRVDLEAKYSITGIKIYNRNQTDERTRLSGMQIKGDGLLIYEDRSQKQTCSFLYPPEGTDVCSDVIRIPLNGHSVQKIKISTDDYLTLCEVQVFGEACSLPTVDNGLLSNTAKHIYKANEFLSFTCNTGYIPRSSETTCLPTKVWSPPPVCNIVNCTAPTLNNGQYLTEAWVSANKLTYTYGTTLNIQCNEWYEIFNGSDSLTCQDDGTWSPSPTCIAEQPSSTSQAAAIGGSVGGSVVVIAVVIGVIVFITIRRRKGANKEDHYEQPLPRIQTDRAEHEYGEISELQTRKETAQPEDHVYYNTSASEHTDGSSDRCYYNMPETKRKPDTAIERLA